MDPTAIVQKGAEYGATLAYTKLKDWIRLVNDYNHNLQNAKDLRTDLEQKLQEIQERVEVEERSNQVALLDVKKWQRNAEDFLHLSNENADWEELLVDEEARKRAERCCFSFIGWNPKYRHHISRVAKEKLDAMGELNNKVNEFGSNLTRSSLPPGLPFNQGEFCEGLRSREKKIEEVMEALQDDKVNRIGIYGMGGAGKTTLVEEIARRAEKEKLFDGIIIVEIAENPNIKLIQNHVADRIGSRALDSIHAVEERAMSLYESLKKLKAKDQAGISQSGCKLLIVLDNLWDRLKLQLIGIYSELEKDMGCKIIVTSRSDEVCRMMDVRASYMFHIGDLDHEEAKQLFKKKVGLEFFEREDYKDLACKVLELCPCLPLSINVLANMLNNQPPYVWKDAIRELENPVAGNIGGRILHETYSIVKMSYQHMKDENQKRFFLLCCLFPPGSTIKFDDLIRYGIGLGMFQYVSSLEEALSQGRKWIDKLKSLSLLLEMDIYKGEITIHDDLREAGKFFEDQGELAFHVGDIPLWLEIESRRKYAAISTTTSNSNYEHLTGSNLPKLQLLRVFGTGPSNFCDNYFSGMQHMQVLDLSNLEFEALPVSIEVLKNLQTLLVENCSVEDISQLAKLTNLRVLSLKGCYVLKKLPREIGNLVGLKLLDLTDCMKLQEIPAHTLEKLTQLEGLYMMRSFTNWQVQGAMTSISELNSLTRLQVLEVAIRCVKQLPLGDFPCPNVTSYKIVYGSKSPILKRDLSFSLDLQVKQVDASQLMKEGWRPLLERAERLYLERLHNFESRTLFLFSLQVLELVDLTGAEYALPAKSAMKLKVLKVSDCKKLKYIFFKAGALEGVNASTDSEDEEIVFPCLEEIKLEKLPSLEDFCFGGSEGASDREVKNTPCKTLFHKKTKFTSLKSLELDDLATIENLWEFRTGDEFSNAFPDLENMSLGNMPKLKHVWCEQMINLQCTSLRVLSITFCPCMEIVCGMRSLTSKELSTLICFPELRTMSLRFMEKLTCFYQGNVNMVFPALKELRLEFLDCFETFGKPTQDTNTDDYPYTCSSGDLEWVDGNHDGEFQMNTLFSHGMVIFPSLECLGLFSLNKIETIWSRTSSSGEEDCVMRFPKLQLLMVFKMDKLRAIWQWCGTSNHEIGCIEAPLRSLVLCSLPMLEGLVDVESDECLDYDVEADANIEASTGEKSHLLSENTKFLLFNGNVTLSSSLKELHLDELDKIETVWDIADVSDEKDYFVMEFLQLNELQIERLPKLKAIWKGGNLHNSGSCIKSSLKTLELSHLPAFEGLAKVETSGRDERGNVGALFDHKLQVIFPSLEKLKICNLENFETIWDIAASHEDCMKFPKLEEINIDEMPKLRHVWNGSIQYQRSVRSIKITGCELMESLVQLSRPMESSFDAEDDESHHRKMRVIKFQSLNSLHIGDLPLTRVLFKQENSTEAARGQVDRLTEGLKASERAFFSGKFEFPSLTKLWVENMPHLEEIFDKSNAAAVSSSFFPTLNSLCLKDCPMLKEKHLPDAIIRKLSSIRVAGFHGLRCLFSSSSSNYGLFEIAALENLQELIVLNCSSLEELFGVGSSDGVTGLSTLPRLKELILWGLVKLNHVPFNILPNLQSIEMQYCFIRNNRVIASVDSVVEGKMLQKLEKLKIKNCEGLEAIIGEENTLLGDHQLVNNDDDPEQAAVVRNGKTTNVAIKLPLLKTVKFKELATLDAFSLANCSVILPSLESVVISNALSMKTFTSRNVVAPKLSTVKIDTKEIEVDEDVNTILQRQMKDKCKVIEKWPKKLKNMLHKEHELTLMNRLFRSCDKCHEELDDMEQLITSYWYCCVPCDVDLHATCALEETQLIERPQELEVAQNWPRTLQHELHSEHSLQLTMGKLYTCAACEHEGLDLFAFSCDKDDCKFNLHPRCALDEKFFPKEFDNDKEPDHVTSSIQLSTTSGSSGEPVVSPSVTASTSTKESTGVALLTGDKSLESQSSSEVSLTPKEEFKTATEEILSLQPAVVLPSPPTVVNLLHNTPNISPTTPAQEDPSSSLVIPLFQQLLTSMNSTNALLLDISKKLDTTNPLLVDISRKLDAALSDKASSSISDSANGAAC